MCYYTPMRSKEMQEKAQPVYDKVRADLGDELVDTLLAATK